MDAVSIGILLAVIIGVFALKGKSDGGSGGKGIAVTIIRWDQLSGSTITRNQEEPFLQRMKKRAPFYARIVAGKLRIRPNNLTNIVKQQMSYMLSAGITSQIFNGPAKSVVGDSYGLLKMEDAYRKIKNPPVQFTRAIFGKGKGAWSNSQVDKMIREHVSMMHHSHWEKYQGRPLLYVLRPRNFDMKTLVKKIRAEARKQKIQDPFIVAQRISHAYKYAASFRAAGFDGFSDYGPSYGAGTKPKGQGNSYKTATAILKGTMKLSIANAKKHQIVYIPSICPAWNPLPRKIGKPRYHHYKDPAPGEWEARLKGSFSLIKDGGKWTANKLNIYGLGENSEGGTIMPTMGAAPKYIPNTQLLSETRKAIKGK